MTRRMLILVFVGAACLLWGGCLTVHAQYDAQSASWGSTSAYRRGAQSVSATTPAQPAARAYTPAYHSISAYDADFDQGVKLSSYFRFTTADALLSDDSPFGSGVPKNQRRGVLGWGEPDDNPVGEVPNTTPVGEPFALLLLAALYAVRRRKE